MSTDTTIFSKTTLLSEPSGPNSLSKRSKRTQTACHYVEDPSIGLEKVERILDAAHALSLQCRRNLSIRKQTEDEQKEAKLRFETAG